MDENWLIKEINRISRKRYGKPMFGEKRFYPIWKTNVVRVALWQVDRLLTQEEIARITGLKERSTISFAAKKIMEMSMIHPEIKQELIFWKIQIRALQSESKKRLPMYTYEQLKNAYRAGEQKANFESWYQKIMS